MGHDLKQQKMKKLVRHAFVLASLAGITLMIGHGCSGFQSATGFGSTALSLGSTGGTGGGPGFVAKPGVPTASVVYAKSALDSMVACTGIESPSEATLLEYEKRKGSFTEYGYATEVTAPMIMAVTSMAGEVCRDLVKKEKAMSSDARRVFKSFNFAQGPAALASGDIADATRRLARLCWSRDESQEEMQIFDSEIKSAYTGTLATDTEKAALALCTGVLGSLEGYSL